MKKLIIIGIVICLLSTGINVVGDDVTKDDAVLIRPPVADIGGPYSGKIYEEITFDGSGSFDLNDDIVSYIWDFGDGKEPLSTDEPTITYSYDYTGFHKVSLAVVDSRDQVDIDITSATINFDQKKAVIMVGRCLGWPDLDPNVWGPPDWPNMG